MKHEWLQHDGDLKLLFRCKHVGSTSVCVYVCVIGLIVHSDFLMLRINEMDV